jgi:hypothetical protein
MGDPRIEQLRIGDETILVLVANSTEDWSSTAIPSISAS